MPDRRKWLVLFGMFGATVQTHEWCRCQLLGRINSEEKQFGSPSETKGISRTRDTGKILKHRGLLKRAGFRSP